MTRTADILSIEGAVRNDVRNYWSQNVSLQRMLSGVMIVGIAVQLLMIGYMQSITGDKPDSLWTAYCLVLFGTLVASVKSILLTRKGLDFKTALPLMDKYDALDKQCMEDLKAFISGNRNPAACEDAVTNWAQHEARLASEATATPSEA